MIGLAPKTLKVFKDASKLSCIKDYVLVGGTALSLQINHRLSEDLDFCKWVQASSAENAIPFQAFEKELKKHFTTAEVNPIDFDQADYLINGEVRFQFFNEVGYKLPTKETISLEGNIRIAPIITIGAMKIKTMFQRNVFRDYYDAYAIVKGEHLTFPKLIEVACSYDNKLNADMIIKRLVTHKKFREEKVFRTLSPKYDVSPEIIGNFFKKKAAEVL
jgi:predicted nucleotidyltransferase component of viral defense system